MLAASSRTKNRSKKNLKISLIDKAISHSDNEMKSRELSPISCSINSSEHLSSFQTQSQAQNQQENTFKRTLSSPWNECIAPHRKGNFVTTIHIDELNGWLLTGQCSGTVNAWRIPTKQRQNNEEKVYECHNLLPFEEGGVRHLYCFENTVICLIGFRRICVFKNYDKNSIIRMKLGLNEFFTYSPFTSPHFFYSTQCDHMVHIFCRSMGSAVKINLKTQKKEAIEIEQKSKIPIRTNVLSTTKYFVIWQQHTTNDNFYSEQPGDLKENKVSNSKFIKMLNKYGIAKKRKYQTPNAKKIFIRSLTNMNLIHNKHYFEPLSVHDWGFQFDDVSMTMSFVTQLNKIKIVQITPNFELMQYGMEYDAKVNGQNDLLLNESSTNGVSMNENDSNVIKNGNNSLIDALTLSSGMSRDTSIEMESDMNTTTNIHQNNHVNIQNQMNRDDHSHGHGHKGGVKELYSFRGHKGYVVAMDYTDGILVSIGTDHKMCVYDGRKGKLLASMTNIRGNFLPGYPYCIKRGKIEKNKIFYTADDGIFIVVF